MANMALILSRALHIREEQAYVESATFRAQEAIKPFLDIHAGIIAPIVERCDAIEDEIARLEGERAALLLPYEEALEENEKRSRAAYSAVMTEAQDRAKVIPGLRQELGALLGAAAEETGTKTFPFEAEDFDLQVSVTKALTVVDARRAVSTFIDVAPRGEWGQYLTPTKAGLDVIAAFAGIKDAKKPIAEIQEAVAGYEGFALEVTYTPKFLVKTPATEEPEDQIARAAEIFGESEEAAS